MALVLTIPDEILETLKIPKKKVERELMKELAFLSNVFKRTGFNGNGSKIGRPDEMGIYRRAF